MANSPRQPRPQSQGQAGPNAGTPGHARCDRALAGDAPVFDDRSQDGLAGNVQ